MVTNNKDLQKVKILTIDEVAKLLRIHRTTVSRYSKSGELKSYLIGSRRLFKEIEVLSFFDNRIDNQIENQVI
jgi:excisionase family DNA binding protein